MSTFENNLTWAEFERVELRAGTVVNAEAFPETQIGPFISEVLVTGFTDETGAIVLAQPERLVPNGAWLV